MDTKWIIRGREINEGDIIAIRQFIKKYSHKGRTYISRELCHYWKWYQSNGHTKDMACRYILLFLEKKGHIKLPPWRHPNYNKNRKIDKIELKENILTGTVKDYPDIKIELQKSYEGYRLWNRIIDSYHYQGYQIIVGKFLKYLVYINNEPAACLGWGSPAWSIKPRDRWIGWEKKVKDNNLCKIANNIRFLILPWIKIKYLASYLLGINAKIVTEDWKNCYGDNLYLLETFVEEERFQGTCYKAANWIYLGRTKGSAKKGSSHTFHGKIKKIFVYPLCKDFRQHLIKG